MTTTLIDSLEGKRALLIASTGGHLAQLHRIRQSAQLGGDPLWVTFRSEQSESLLAGERVRYVPYIAPRDWRATAAATRIVRQVVDEERFDLGISTGAALAVAALPLVRLARRRAIYIESVSRFAGPSLSGRILQRVPGVELYTQHGEWATERWKHEFSVLDDYSAETGRSLPDRPLRVFVTLGTIRPYRFDLLVDSLNKIDRPIELSWQLGVTDRADLPGEVNQWLEADEFAARLAWSDVVVSHAGVGTALQLLDMGIRPVLIPRRSARGEHVDDHQEQVAAYLGRRDLTVTREADEVDYNDLVDAASSRIVRGMA
jgi:UDP-N-acetylglucosamine--N-acetylmuramyl-(pentapeptide) pyrophosphoryl-undecaprenol N-acetylglucosamine transferase